MFNQSPRRQNRHILAGKVLIVLLLLPASLTEAQDASYLPLQRPGQASVVTQNLVAYQCRNL